MGEMSVEGAGTWNGTGLSSSVMGNPRDSPWKEPSSTSAPKRESADSALELSTKWCGLWCWKLVKREVALKSFEHLWEGWRTKKTTRTYRLVRPGVPAQSRRKHEDFRGRVRPWGISQRIEDLGLGWADKPHQPVCSALYRGLPSATVRLRVD